MKSSVLLIGLLVIVIALSGCTEPPPTACTMEAKVCPDGTAVGRNPALNCEFDPCPSVECKGEGETIPVIANPPECCKGLVLIPPKDLQTVGIMGYCTSKCGNGICDEIESTHNCLEDCEEEIDLCGNGFCEVGETETNCPQDCNGCYEMTNSALEDIGSVIENAFESEAYTGNVNFSLSGCFEDGTESAKIIELLEPDCEEMCGEYKGICLILQYSNSEQESYSTKKCLNASADTMFLTEGETCIAWPGYELKDFREAIPEGEYLIGRKSGLSAPIPILCAYRKMA